MVGKTFSTDVADGYAKYEVTEEHENVVRIERRPIIHGEYGDIGYTDAILGEGCIITKANVVKAIEFSERFGR